MDSETIDYITVLIGVFTSLFMLTLLAYKAFTLEETWNKIRERYDSEILIITLLALFLPFLLSYFSSNLLFLVNPLEIIRTISTVFLAFIAIKGYGKIVVNKANEEQLRTVVNLVRIIRKTRIICIAINAMGNDFPMGNKNFLDNRIYHLIDDPLEFIEIIKEDSNKISEKAKKTTSVVYIKRSEYEHLEETLKSYSKSPIIPDQISKKIKEFIENIRKNKGTHKHCVLITNDIDAILYKRKVTDIYSWYTDWDTIEQYSSKMIEEVVNWLEDKNVKDINLPKISKFNK